MEKAYSKLHQNYENICDGSILEGFFLIFINKKGLVDLTGGVSEGWNLTDSDTIK